MVLEGRRPCLPACNTGALVDVLLKFNVMSPFKGTFIVIDILLKLMEAKGHDVPIDIQQTIHRVRGKLLSHMKKYTRGGMKKICIPISFC